MGRKREKKPRRVSSEVLIDRVNLYDQDITCPHCEMLIGLDSYEVNLLIKSGKCEKVCEHCNSLLTCHLL